MIDTGTAPCGAPLFGLTLGVPLVAHGVMRILVFTVPRTVGTAAQVKRHQGGEFG